MPEEGAEAAPRELSSQFEDPVFDLADATEPTLLQEEPRVEPPSEMPTAPLREATPSEAAAAQEAVSVESADVGVIDIALAPPWRRLAAGVVDALPLGGALMLMLLIFERDLDAGHAPMVPTSLHDLARIFLSLGKHAWIILAGVCLVSVLYHAFSVAFMRATVGDLLFGIRWLTKRGEPPRLGRAATRAVLQLPSWLFAMFGVWFVLLTRTRRTLYDVLSGCYPVSRSS